MNHRVKTLIHEEKRFRDCMFKDNIDESKIDPNYERELEEKIKVWDLKDKEAYIKIQLDKQALKDMGEL